MFFGYRRRAGRTKPNELAAATANINPEAAGEGKASEG